MRESVAPNAPVDGTLKGYNGPGLRLLLDPGPDLIGEYVLGDRVSNLPTKHHLRLVRDGWRLRRVIDWPKPAPAPEAA